MQTVTVPDPSGANVMDQRLQAQIPCVRAGQQLVLGDAGAAAGAVNETCTLTIIQLQPAVAGLAVTLKDNSGLESNFVLSAAS
jgi:hypothetical protein